MKDTIGKWFMIKSYKHDGRLHRTWERSVLLSQEECLICANEQVRVTEASGKEWITKEPAICFFPYGEWFNIIAMLREDGIHYYCNLSSPAKWQGDLLTYIDYDLDVRVYPNYSYELLDDLEFEENRERMGYPLKTVTRIRTSAQKLLREVEQRKKPFRHDDVLFWYEKYRRLIGKS